MPVPAVSALGRGQHPAWSALHTVDMDDVPLLRRLRGEQGGDGCRDPARLAEMAEQNLLRKGAIISGYP